MTTEPIHLPSHLEQDLPTASPPDLPDPAATRRVGLGVIGKKICGGG